MGLSWDIFNKALEGKTAGIKVNGTAINNIGNADDTVSLVGNIEDLQRLHR